MIRSTLTLFATLFLFSSTFAQHSLQNLENVERIVMPTIDNNALQAKEQERRKRKEVPEFATNLPVEITPFTHGTWEYLPNEKALWRIRILSKDAYNINLGFGRYNMPKSGKMFIYNIDQSDIKGPFTAADNEVHGEFWSPIIKGDEIVIEVEVDTREKMMIDLELDDVNHGYGGQYLLQNCHLDVVCGLADNYPEVEKYRDIIQSVAMYTIAGTRICTGFLVNNARQDCKPYFMTAQHCDVSTGSAASIVVHWNFENSNCREITTSENGLPGDGSLEDFNSGATLLAEYETSDMQLLLLDDPVSDKANAYFAGWDNSKNMPESTICIHHPDTEEKRISFDYEPTFVGTWDDDDVPVPNGNHLVVSDWDLGSTEGGSSGAPLFNQDGFVIGQLHGGLASCTNDAYDSFGWMNTSWEGGGSDDTSLKNWLDPDNLGIEVLEGKWNTACGQTLIPETYVINACANEITTINLTVGDASSEVLTLSFEDFPESASAIFSQNMVMAGDSVQFSVGNLGAVTGQSYVFSLISENELERFTTLIKLNVFADDRQVPVLLLPSNNNPSVVDKPLFSWEVQQEGTEYDFQLATDMNFEELRLEQIGLMKASFSSPVLASNTQYFWRVRSRTPCGESDWGSIFSFKTVGCMNIEADNLPIAIAPSAPSDYYSAIEVMEDGLVIDVDVIGIVGRHSWISDLQIWLISPAGTEVLLVDRPCSDENDFAFSFNDDSELINLPCPPTDQGTYQAVEALSVLMGENARGTWQLKIRDNESQDGGTLNEWSLQLCLAGNDIGLSLSQDAFTICEEEEIELVLLNGEGFGETRILSAAGLPEDIDIIFTPNIEENTTAVQLGNLSTLPAGDYEVLFTLSDSTTQNFATLFLTKQAPPTIPVLLSPSLNDIVLDTIALVSWEADPNTTSTLEFTTDSTFTNDIIAISLETNELPLNLENGVTYYWRVVSMNDCGLSTSEISSFNVQLPVSVEEWTGAKINIFPNPNNGQFYIDLEEIQDLISVEIRSLDAKLIQRQDLRPNQKHLLNLENVPQGVYLIRLVSENNGVLTKRIVVN